MLGPSKINVPALGVFVLCVIHVGPEKQMSRVAAWRIVATMQHMQVAWNWTINHEPCFSVGALLIWLANKFWRKPIALWIFCANPFDAVCGVIAPRKFPKWASL
jgi:hypothetical protein